MGAALLPVDPDRLTTSDEVLPSEETGRAITEVTGESPPDISIGGQTMRCKYGPCGCEVGAPGSFCSQACSLAPENGPFCSCEHEVCEASIAGLDQEQIPAKLPGAPV